MTKEISISTCFDYTIPINRQIELISNTGFTHVSLGASLEHFNYLCKDNRKQLANKLAEFRLKVDTIHACRVDDLSNVDRLVETLKAAQDLEVATIVVHASEFVLHENDIDIRIETVFKVCSQIQEKARHYGIRIAIENVFPGHGDIVVIETLKNLDRETFGFCYDSSHDQIGGPKDFNLLRELSDRVFTVHLSDRQKEFVDHMVPGEGFIDFNEIISILSSVNYTYPLLFEVMNKNTKFGNTKTLLDEVYNEGMNLVKR